MSTAAESRSDRGEFRRWTARIAMALLGGALISLALALAGAVRATDMVVIPGALGLPKGTAATTKLKSTTWPPIMRTAETWSGPDHAMYAGWPWPVVWCRTANYSPPGADLANGSWVIAHDLLTPGRLAVPRPIPLWPRPVHLAAASLMWGVLVFAAIFATGIWQRAHRRRHGLCISCGYDLRGTPAGSPCPECGRVARPRQAINI